MCWLYLQNCPDTAFQYISFGSESIEHKQWGVWGKTDILTGFLLHKQILGLGKNIWEMLKYLRVAETWNHGSHLTCSVGLNP